MKSSVALMIGLCGGYVLNQAGLIDSFWTESRADPVPFQREDGPSGRRPKLVAQATTGKPEPVSTDSNVKVDETALRYFAARGDTRRLETEIARLRALYPTWVPPENPLAVRELTDPLLDRMWKLYSEGKFAELRKAIGERQDSEAGWQVPADLLERLAVAEAREQLVNAFDLNQHDTVIRLAASNPSLLTCGDVDALWRVAEAFSKTDRQQRAKDAYLYVLRNCEKPAERTATIQKAALLLPATDVDDLLATERNGEFEAVRADIARSRLAAANTDPKSTVKQSDLALVEKLADKEKRFDDLLLVAWYYSHREDPISAEEWFRKAYAVEKNASSTQGLALSLIDIDRPQEAESILYEWRGTDDETRKTYLAAVANVLAISPPPALDPAVLQRMAVEVALARDAPAGQQFGWYADSFNQIQTAAQWFEKALGWNPQEEPAAYGLALARWKLGDEAGAKQIQTAWAGRSERISTVGQPSIETAAIAPNQALEGRPPAPPPGTPANPPVEALPGTSLGPGAIATPSSPVALNAPAAPAAPVAPGVQVERVAPVERGQTTAGASRSKRRGCRGVYDNTPSSPTAALAQGWCLLESKRPIEAAEAFQAALRGPSRVRSEAAYGQSLAYIQAGLPDKAAIASSDANIGGARAIELKSALLSEQATAAFEGERYMEALIALDERARLVGERNDLLVLRGYCYLSLRRYSDAEKVFRASAAAGNRDAIRGLNDVRSALEPRGSMN